MDVIVDGFGNEIVIGKQYVCTMYGPKSVQTSKRFGVAIEVWAEGTVPYVRLDMTRTEEYYNGSHVGSSYNLAGRGRTQVFQGQFVFPVPVIENQVTLMDKVYDGFEAAIDIDRDISEMFDGAEASGIPSEWQGSIRIVATYKEPQE